MIKIDIFLVLFPVGYLKTILVPEKNKVLKDPLDLSSWLYMACWVGISERSDWWSVTPEVMHIGAPFNLNIH